MSSKMSFIEIAKRSAETVEKYRKKLEVHLRTIRKVAVEYFGPDVRIYLFGSVLRGNYGPQSDIDVAVVLKRRPSVEERVAFRSRIREELGLFHPFEIHIVSEDEWRGWYGRFLKGEWREIEEQPTRRDI